MLKNDGFDDVINYFVVYVVYLVNFRKGVINAKPPIIFGFYFQ